MPNSEPTNLARQAQKPFTALPPNTGHGTMPNLKRSFADSYMRLYESGWARQATIRELPTSRETARGNMQLKRMSPARCTGTRRASGPMC